MGMHTAVLLKEVIRELNIQKSGFYCDATFGRGGHSKEILSLLNKDGRLLAIDCDFEAIKVARDIALEDKRLFVVHGFFSKIMTFISNLDIVGRVNGILLDLGISSPQIETSKRGFSFLRNEPLDMRMNDSYGLSASDWLAQASVQDITWVLKTLGEERFSSRIAKAIVQRRRWKMINTTQELASLVLDTIPYVDKNNRSLARVFRAIRMYINRELEEIIQVLESSLTVLAPGGKLLVISFHSGEDRVVKNFMRKYSNYRGFIPPYGLPMTEIQLTMRFFNECKFGNLNKIFPSHQEKEKNPRARSAVMRVAERL